MNMPEWLNDAVFYEIYPQSFQDSNDDGIGDINGIISRLDYIKDLGCNAIWLNPCYDSPFKDAGYDVRDYKLVAPRYGTNEDLFHLFEEAHRRGMHVLLDLVAGHTSEEHAWFKASQKQEKNEYSGRYIWTDFCFEGIGGSLDNFIAGESERSGAYLVNFYKSQPALNYGFLHPQRPWQDAIDDPAALSTREALKDIMRYWMDHGCDGFRVDMAPSLVKNDDEKKTGTSAVWHDIRKMFDEQYPACVLLSEWSNPKLSIPAGFHMDFLLNDNPGSGYSTLLRDYGNHGDTSPLGGSGFNGDGSPMPALEDHSFFKKDAGGDIRRFLDPYMEMYKAAGEDGYICLISCNHDTVRASYSLTTKELKLFYAFLYTMPGIPFLYYGDEIGMRYLNIPTKEGGYYRTGSRTPMQWNSGRNYGFSNADASKLYLQQDSSAQAPDVAAARKDKDSLYSTIRELIALRHQIPDLHAQPNLEILYAEGPVLVYRRGSILVGINTQGKEITVPLGDAAVSKEVNILFMEGNAASSPDNSLVLGPQTAVVYDYSRVGR